MKLTNTHLKLQSFNVVDIDEILDNWTKFSDFRISYSFSGCNQRFHIHVPLHVLWNYRAVGIKRLKVMLLKNELNPRPILLILNAWPSK